MSGREDLRVRRTKKALFDAFMNLLKEKSFDEITINELCDTAGIRRATFYKHYADKFDFLTAYTRLLRDRFDSLIWRGNQTALTPEYYVSYAKSLVHFINENDLAINNLRNSNLFPSVLAIIMEQNYKDTCERLRISVSEGLKFSASIEITAAMCTGGVAAALNSWISGNKTMDINELAEQVGSIISNIISPAK